MELALTPESEAPARAGQRSVVWAWESERFIYPDFFRNFMDSRFTMAASEPKLELLDSLERRQCEWDAGRGNQQAIGAVGEGAGGSARACGQLIGSAESRDVRECGGLTRQPCAEEEWRCREHALRCGDQRV